ncbi:MBOAT family O-acyltransferase [Geminicoccus roseus]|uniref:MBOAT family O-acyltransferase n=1 Tax=Geminicoccus roseus TaxID=404900 RepID=UPI00041FCFF2|nr:MBOAT family O-acyltransferase [Geminicoccus roseus]
MLFNSFAFIFGFMPLVLLGFYLLGRLRWRRAALLWLGAASLLFYGIGDYQHLPLLLASIAFNFAVGTAISRRAARGRPNGILLAFGVTVDVLVLGWFKYADFVLGNIAAATGLAIEPLGITLPVGISFFTFTQIAYLADCWRGETRTYRPHEYFLFVTYFPHLIAGPILLHKDVIPQFWKERPYRFELARILVGLGIFGIGLFKKVVLADGVAPYAETLFGGVAAGAAPDLGSAWIGALAYTIQLYFDFSGYSDMAVGLSHMLGFRLPVNFWSPYQAASIIEFWRRWHITLSRFLADHLYKPLGGNRRGARRRHLNLMITMLVGGLWHGAGWTFVAWGALHGLYLVINHAWRGMIGGTAVDRLLHVPALRPASVLVTFLAVVAGWVIFRADSMAVAGTILQAMVGLGDGERLFSGTGAAWIHLALLLAILFLAPNTFQIMRRYAPYRFEGRSGTLGGQAEAARPGPGRLTWRMEPGWALATGLVLLVAVLSMLTSRPSPFLYFQF